MRHLSLPILVAASLALAAPVTAQTNDLGDFVSGMAKSLIAQELELNAYREAQRLNTADAYRNFLAQYPNGSQRASAERALQNLATTRPVTQPQAAQPQPAPNQRAAAAEAALRLTRNDRMQIQTQLKTLGYYAGVIDGLWGRETRYVIGRWQASNDMAETTYVTRQQLDLLSQQTRPAPVTQKTAIPTQDDALEERLLDLSRDERRDVQRRLTRLGYSTRGLDGVFGSDTRRALATWQRDEGQPVTGYITADQLRELRRQTGG